LSDAMSRSQFRADLYFRLNIFPIHVPPLRERPQDIPDLVKHFIQYFARRMNPRIDGVTAYSLKLLTQYHWPGNVRELENIIERAMIIAVGTNLRIDPQWLNPARNMGETPSELPRLAAIERRAIVDALTSHRGKVYGPDGAAAALGLKPTTLYGKMRKYQIPKRPPSE